MKTHFCSGEVKAVTRNRFHFGIDDCDPELKKTANLKLLQLLAIAPPAASGLGFVQQSEHEFLATITIQSSFRSFVAKAVSANLELAVRKCLERMEDDLLRWRFGSGSGNSSEREVGLRA